LNLFFFNAHDLQVVFWWSCRVLAYSFLSSLVFCLSILLFIF
jgi:hypothetical protein